MATMTLDELVSQLRKAYGDELVTVVLYGSAAAGEHIAKRSDYNVLVIVRSLALDRLRAEAAVARAWRVAGNPPPLTLTMEEWLRSADIFPMEYADILERHRALYGTPPFGGIKVDPEHLRLQVEHEAMGALIQFRQGILAAGGVERELVELLASSLSTIMVIFRAVIRLHGAAPTTDYTLLSRDVGQRAGLDPEPFVRVVRHVKGEARIAPNAVGDVLAGYISGLQALVAHLDQFASRRAAASSRPQ
jgi:predicted nucleotidyltransferase